MNVITKKKFSIDKKAVLLYIIIFFSGDTYLFGTNENVLTLSLSRYFLIIVCLCLALKTCKRIDYKNNKAKIISYFFIFFLFAGISLIHQDNLNKTIVKLLSITIAFFLCMNWSFDEYAKCFNKVVYFIALCAIVYTTLAYINPSFIMRFPRVFNTSGTGIYTCVLAGLDERSLNSLAVRTNGIFWEPGVFQMYLNIAISFELLYKKKSDRKSLIAYYVALLFTFSTTGYIVAVWVLCSYVLFSRNQSNVQQQVKKKIAVVVLLAVILYIALFTPITDVLLGKLSKTSVDYGSTNVRLAGVVANIDIALENPLFGVGMDRMEEEFIRATTASNYLKYWTRMNTNTFFYQFAAHGMLYGILFVIGTFKFGNCFSESKKMIITISIFIMLLLLYIGENLELSTLPYVIVFYGYGSKDAKLSSYSSKSRLI